MAIKGTVKKMNKEAKVEEPRVAFPAVIVRENGVLNFSPSAVELLDNTHIIYDDEGFIIPCKLEKDEEGNYINEMYNLSVGLVEITKSTKRRLPKTGNVSYKEAWSDFVTMTQVEDEETGEMKEVPESGISNVYRLVSSPEISDDLETVANGRPVYKLEFAYDTEQEAIEAGVDATAKQNSIA